MPSILLGQVYTSFWSGYTWRVQQMHTTTLFVGLKGTWPLADRALESRVFGDPPRGLGTHNQRSRWTSMLVLWFVFLSLEPQVTSGKDLKRSCGQLRLWGPTQTDVPLPSLKVSYEGDTTDALGDLSSFGFLPLEKPQGTGGLEGHILTCSVCCERPLYGRQLATRIKSSKPALAHIVSS